MGWCLNMSSVDTVLVLDAGLPHVVQESHQ